MIEEKNGLFFINTENTSYIFSVQDTGYPEHIYYGKRLKNAPISTTAIREKHLKAPTMSTLADPSFGEFSLNDTLLEFSSEGKGDYKTPFVAISLGEKAERTLSLKYIGHKITKGIVRFSGNKMPQAVATEEEAETLSVSFLDENRDVLLTLYYTAFYHTDVITRRSVITNSSSSPLVIRSLSSLQLDLRSSSVSITSFSGAWGRERKRENTLLSSSTFVNESRTISGGETDPTVIIQNGKDCYLTSLIYSGAHKTSVSITPEGITHIVSGINNELFSWFLDTKESFETPEAILTYSDKSVEGAGDNMKTFINRHIRRGLWKNRMKPIMLNTWDTLFFDPNESEVLKMAEEAKALGMEGIVIDDGWFGARVDNTSSLGDWYPDTRNFPSGLKELSGEVHYMGLMFGLWFEMEGISERSMLYQSHPDWIVGKVGEKKAISNNQQLLDITKPEVAEWVINTVNRIVESAALDYIRWNFSRFQGDLYSTRKDSDEGEFMHRYNLALYYILDTITKTHPNLYIEGCAKGGLRCDMGMLSYFSSVTLTQSTDPVYTNRVLEDTALIYPLSVISRTISGNPDKYSQRNIDSETKFNSSVFGILQYSINPHELSKIEKFVTRQQIEFYKGYRPLFQYGTFRKTEDENKTIWTLYNSDSSTIMVFYFQKKVEVNTTAEKLYIECANENYTYSFMARSHIQNKIELVMKPQEIECYTISGDALKWAGITLADNNSGNGWEDGMRTLQDYTSKLYIIKKNEDKE